MSDFATADGTAGETTKEIHMLPETRPRSRRPSIASAAFSHELRPRKRSHSMADHDDEADKGEDKRAKSSPEMISVAPLTSTERRILDILARVEARLERIERRLELIQIPGDK